MKRSYANSKTTDPTGSPAIRQHRIKRTAFSLVMVMGLIFSTVFLPTASAQAYAEELIYDETAEVVTESGETGADETKGGSLTEDLADFEDVTVIEGTPSDEEAALSALVEEFGETDFSALSTDPGPAVYAKATAPTPYAWSKTAAATTGDFFADTYSGVEAGNVFEDVNVDRLADILSAEGDYYVAFANPKSEAGQKILQTINAEAKNAGVDKIYVFNPIVDNFRLDITSDNSAIRDIQNGTWASGISEFGTIPHSIGGIYTYIKSFLPAYYGDSDEDKANKALFDGYKSDQTLLFRFHKDNHTDLAKDASIEATYLITPADLLTYNQTQQVEKIAAVYRAGDVVVPANVRTEYQFLKRGYDQTISDAKVRFQAEDYPNGEGFNLNSVTFEEAFNILNSPGEHAFIFAEFGCSNTQAVIAATAKSAKKHNKTVYVIDGSFGGSIRYGQGADIDKASSSTSNAWLNIRLAASATAQKQLNYIYGELIGYFGDGFITENESAKSTGSTIQYYVNGDVGNAAALTKFKYSNPQPAGPYNAPRLQYPIVLSYNNAYVQPVTIDTTEIEVTKIDTVTGWPTLKEYMLTVANVSKGTDARTLKGLQEIDNVLNLEFINNVRNVQNSVANIVSVPNLVGLPVIDAKEAAQNAGLVWGGSSTTIVTDKALDGKVISSSPTADVRVNKGSGVNVVVGQWNDPAGKTAKVPTLVGLSRAAAEAAVHNAGLVWGGYSTQIVADKSQDGKVISSNPAEGVAVTAGSNVSVVIGQWDGISNVGVAVPNLVGKTAKDAKTAVEDAELGWNGISETRIVTDKSQDGKVLSSDPSAGTLVDKGTGVSVVLGHWNDDDTKNDEGSKAYDDTKAEDNKYIPPTGNAVITLARYVAATTTDAASDSETVAPEQAAIGDDDIPLAGSIADDTTGAKSDSADGNENSSSGIPLPIAAGALGVAALAFVGIGIKTGFLGQLFGKAK